MNLLSPEYLNLLLDGLDSCKNTVDTLIKIKQKRSAMSQKEITDAMVKKFLNTRVTLPSYQNLDYWEKEWDAFLEGLYNPREPFNWVVFTKDGFGFETWSPKSWAGDAGNNWDETVHTFEKLNDAKEYILMNNPCLSINDIKSIKSKYWSNDHVIDELKELANSKIQGR